MIIDVLERIGYGGRGGKEFFDDENGAQKVVCFLNEEWGQWLFSKEEYGADIFHGSKIPMPCKNLLSLRIFSKNCRLKQISLIWERNPSILSFSEISTVLVIPSDPEWSREIPSTSVLLNPPKHFMRDVFRPEFIIHTLYLRFFFAWNPYYITSLLPTPVFTYCSTQKECRMQKSHHGAYFAYNSFFLFRLCSLSAWAARYFSLFIFSCKDFGTSGIKYPTNQDTNSTKHTKANTNANRALIIIQ